MATNGTVTCEARCAGAKTEMFIRIVDADGWKMHLLMIDETNIIHTVVRDNGSHSSQIIDRNGDGHPDEERESERPEPY